MTMYKRLMILLCAACLGACSGDDDGSIPNKSADAGKNSPDSVAATCTTTCSGCCQNGSCEPGGATTACGVGGEVCAVCSAGEVCEDGKCRPAACTTGCKDGAGTCQPGNDDAACGKDGDPCTSCKTGETCTAGVCVATCSHVTCPSGCCEPDGTCAQGTSGISCGSGGGPCQTCASQEQCLAGQCVKQQDCSQCQGCCLNGNQCMPGSTPSACGAGGAACKTCQQGESCVNGQCQAVNCDLSNCQDGCCTANNQCIPFVQQSLSVCGKNAAACNVCGPSDKTCQQGTCVQDQPCLTYCKQGCCTPQGQCLDFTQQDKSSCGVGGQCKSCGALSCVNGKCVQDPAWEVWIESAVIAPKKPDGSEWDSTWLTNPLPDPYVTIALGGSTFVQSWTKTIDNTLTPAWNEKVKVWAESELTAKGLMLSLRDSEGLGVFETIATCSTAVTATTLAAGGHTIAKCGQSVTSLKVKFVKQ